MSGWRFRKGFCGFLFCLPAAALAQSESVVVTASRLERSGDGADISVIDARTIAARNPASVVDLLRDLPNVQVQQAGGRGSVVSLFVRGAQPNFTLVLLDGVKSNDSTNTRGGSYDFSTLDMNDIERVELVRGPASAVYGSDALGGVLNIITRHGGPVPDFAANAEAGSFGYMRYSGHVSGPVGEATANLGLSYTDAGQPTPGNTLKSTSLNGALALPELAGISIRLNGRYSDSTASAFPDSSGGPRLAVLRSLDRRSIQESVLGTHAARALTDWWRIALDYGFYQRDSTTASPGVAPSAQTPTGIPPNGDNARFTRQQVTWTNRVSLGDGLEAAFGLDMQAEHGTDNGFINFGPVRVPTLFSLSRTTWAGFAEALYHVTPALSLSGSLRFDSAPGVDRTSPQFRARYGVPGWGTQFQFLWGKAFRLPSFYALGNPIVGDPGLRPELAENFEGGITQTLWTSGRLKLEGFSTNYRNLIDFQPGAIPKLVNLSAVEVRGFEASLELAWDDLTLTPRFSYTHARNSVTGTGLRDVPDWLAGFTLLWQPDDKWNLSFNLNHVGALTDNSIPTGDVVLPSRERVDLSVSYAITSGMRARIGIDNLFGQRYEDVAGFPTVPTVVRGGLSASL